MDERTVGDARFFRRCGPFDLADVAAAAKGTVSGGRDSDRLSLMGVAPLQAARPDEVSFLDNKRYASILETTTAGAVIVHPDFERLVPAGTVPIVTKAPYEGWARAAALFHPDPAAVAGVHPLAVIDADAIIDPTVEIGPFTTVGAGASIGAGTLVGSHVSIGPGVVIGRDCRIASHCTISHALLGDRVCLLPGARIGQEGFGFAVTAGGFLSVPQLGRVILEHDVNIGANTTIDRGSAQDTVIGAGSRIDNLVQIGHNVRLGRCCAIAAQVGVSGSTVLEDFVQMGGQAGITGHVTIGKGTQLAAQSGIISDVPPGSVLMGTPAQPIREHLRQVATLKRLSRKV